MAKEQIEKTLVILDENQARQVHSLAQQHDQDAIYRFVREVIAKKVEDALRMRCK